MLTNDGQLRLSVKDNLTWKASRKCSHDWAVQLGFKNLASINISDVASQRHLRFARRHYLVVPRHSLSSYGRRTLLLPVAQLPGTHWAMICVIRRLTLTVSDVCVKLGCFQST